MKTAERRLWHVLWLGIVVLCACVALHIHLPVRGFDGVAVSHENGLCVLRDGAGTLLLDPWQRPYLYLDPTPAHPRPRVVSLGADGRLGGAGDSADIDSDEALKELR